VWGEKAMMHGALVWVNWVSMNHNYSYVLSLAWVEAWATLLVRNPSKLEGIPLAMGGDLRWELA